jgi:hypothetical protein
MASKAFIIGPDEALLHAEEGLDIVFPEGNMFASMLLHALNLLLEFHQKPNNHRHKMSDSNDERQSHDAHNDERQEDADKVKNDHVPLSFP